MKKKTSSKDMNNSDVYISNLDFDATYENEDISSSKSMDIESLVTKLDLHVPLEEIAAEENVSMSSLMNYIEILKEQNVNIDTNYYNESVNYYSNDGEKGFYNEENDIDEYL